MYTYIHRNQCPKLLDTWNIGNITNTAEIRSKRHIWSFSSSPCFCLAYRYPQQPDTTRFAPHALHAARVNATNQKSHRDEAPGLPNWWVFYPTRSRGTPSRWTHWTPKKKPNSFTKALSNLKKCTLCNLCNIHINSQKTKTKMFQLPSIHFFTNPQLFPKTIPNFYRKTQYSVVQNKTGKLITIRSRSWELGLSYTQSMASLPQFPGTKTCRQLRF